MAVPPAPQSKVGTVEIIRNDGTAEPISRNCVLTLAPGERFVTRSAGGGAVGDPLERDPERVREDVIEGFVSVEAARTSTASPRLVARRRRRRDRDSGSCGADGLPPRDRHGRHLHRPRAGGRRRHGRALQDSFDPRRPTGGDPQRAHVDRRTRSASGERVPRRLRPRDPRHDRRAQHPHPARAVQGRLSVPAATRTPSRSGTVTRRTGTATTSEYPPAPMLVPRRLRFPSANAC